MESTLLDKSLHALHIVQCRRCVQDTAWVAYHLAPFQMILCGSDQRCPCRSDSTHLDIARGDGA